MIQRKVAAFLAVLATTIALSACSKNSDDKSSSDSDSSATTAASATTGASTSASAVSIKNFKFDPNALTVKAGATVTINNDDSTTHTFTAEDDEDLFNTGEISKNKSATIEAPDKAGQYKFYCDIHHYMKGTLTVQ